MSEYMQSITHIRGKKWSYAYNPDGFVYFSMGKERNKIFNLREPVGSNATSQTTLEDNIVGDSEPEDLPECSGIFDISETELCEEPEIYLFTQTGINREDPSCVAEWGMHIERPQWEKIREGLSHMHT